MKSNLMSIVLILLSRISCSVAMAMVMTLRCGSQTWRRKFFLYGKSQSIMGYMLGLIILIAPLSIYAKSRFVRRYMVDPRSLDVFTSDRIVGFNRISIDITERLMEKNPDTYEWVPRLAEKLTFDDKQMKFRVRLRKNVKFHDGKELTSEDLAFSFRAISKTDYRKALKKEALRSIKYIKVVDKYTVDFYLTRKDPIARRFIYLLKVLPKHIYEPFEGSDEKARKIKRVIGSGPLIWKSFRRGGNPGLILMKFFISIFQRT